MRIHVAIVRSLLLVAICAPTNGWACGMYGIPDLESLQEQLQDPQTNLEDLAVYYRALGPLAVDQLVALRDQLEQKAPDIMASLDALIDKVAAQRHASRSRLFWYTDFDDAQRIAETSGKPILSLRLLGKLDEEFSCANSRFFRTTLYANAGISKVLRDQFVLHWQSVRPVPKVTVDFGDGRKLQRTVTGNSIHYVVTADGVVLEALPGLYAPAAFKAWLSRSLALHQQLASANRVDKRQALVAYHLGRKNQLLARWRNDLRTAIAAVPRQARQAVPELTVDELLAKTDDAMWELFAAPERIEPEGILDRASIRLIRSENPHAGEAQRLSVSKSIAEDPIFRLVRNLERTIRIDTIRNEYLLHRQLHERLALAANVGGVVDGVEMAQEINDLNAWVYAQVFRSPLHDPWLGLLPAATYNALDNGGASGSELSVSTVRLERDIQP